MQAALQTAYDAIGAPSARQLRFKLLRDGEQVSAKQAEAFVNAQQERQILRPRPASSGQTASLGPGQEYQADLIDFKRRRPRPAWCWRSLPL